MVESPPSPIDPEKSRDIRDFVQIVSDVSTVPGAARYAINVAEKWGLPQALPPQVRGMLIIADAVGVNGAYAGASASAIRNHDYALAAEIIMNRVGCKAAATGASLIASGSIVAVAAPAIGASSVVPPAAVGESVAVAITSLAAGMAAFSATKHVCTNLANSIEENATFRDHFNTSMQAAVDGVLSDPDALKRSALLDAEAIKMTQTLEYYCQYDEDFTRHDDPRAGKLLLLEDAKIDLLAHTNPHLAGPYKIAVSINRRGLEDAFGSRLTAEEREKLSKDEAGLQQIMRDLAENGLTDEKLRDALNSTSQQLDSAYQEHRLHPDMEKAITEYLKAETEVTNPRYAKTKAFPVLPIKEEEILQSLTITQSQQRELVNKNAAERS